jgi:uncharacterized membrane protein YhfC
LVKSHGIDAIINDNLIGTVLTMGGIFVGLLTGAVGLLVVQISPTILNELQYYLVFGVSGLFIGMVQFFILSNVIDSGVVTTFVCLAEDPRALATTKPLLFQEIQRVYPEVAMGF